MKEINDGWEYELQGKYSQKQWDELKQALNTSTKLMEIAYREHDVCPFCGKERTKNHYCEGMAQIATNKKLSESD